MLRYINASQVGNIVKLDTKCCIQEGTTKTNSLGNFENFKEMLYELLVKMWFYKSDH